MSSQLSKWYGIWKLVPAKFDGFEDHDPGIFRVILPFDFEWRFPRWAVKFYHYLTSYVIRFLSSLFRAAPSIGVECYKVLWLTKMATNLSLKEHPNFYATECSQPLKLSDQLRSRPQMNHIPLRVRNIFLPQYICDLFATYCIWQITFNHL
jgi:hypothetical protein